MTQKQEQKYLGDIVSADGKQNSNILARKNKGLGIINQIEQILDTVFYGKYHFEVAMILRSSLFLSAVLLNSEAWANFTHQNIRTLEKTDEILGCEANTKNLAKRRYVTSTLFNFNFYHILQLLALRRGIIRFVRLGHKI